MLPEFAAEIYADLTYSLKKRLSSAGYRVEAPARLLGMSGAEHMADLSATAPDGRTVLVDIYVSHDIVDEAPVISTYVKVLDTSPSQTYLFVMPKVTGSARELANSYKIGLIEGISVDDLIEKFGTELVVNAI